MKLSIFVQISVIAIAVCLEIVACNPLLFAFKTTTKTSPPVQSNQPVNVQVQNTPNPFLDKLRKFRTAMMALVQKKIDELNIVTATLQSQMRPQQSQLPIGSQQGTPGVLTNLAQQLQGVAQGQQLPGVAPGQQLPAVGGLLNPQLPSPQPAPLTSGQQTAVQPGAVSAPVAPQQGVSATQPAPGQQVGAQQGAAGLTNLPVQQPVQPPMATQPTTAG